MRTLRKSSFKDYIAVDIVNDKKEISSTPFYLKTRETKSIFFSDTGDGNNWIRSEVKISADFNKLECKDIDKNSDFLGMEWDSEFDELLDSKVTKFI